MPENVLKDINAPGLAITIQLGEENQIPSPDTLLGPLAGGIWQFLQKRVFGHGEFFVYYFFALAFRNSKYALFYRPQPSCFMWLVSPHAPPPPTALVNHE